MITTIIRTFIIYCAVSLCVRLMGKRQLGQLQPGELVITILISEIAAMPIGDNNVPILNSIIPLFLLVSFEIINSLIDRKSVRFRHLTEGRPITIIRNGELLQKELKELRFTINDVLLALRQKDVFDIEEVEYAVVETNAVFRANSLEPVQAGPIPEAISPLISRICAEQELVAEGIFERDLNKIFCAFSNDPLVTCGLEDAKKLFKEMCENTKEYLTMYDLSQL